mmetsp:Transcript_9738/g.20187  ORF Transcript_9738/g.20187 Transcript_9738/m.20187 type:complete len:107 (+) Transcript_9738:590-910(+)
MEEELLYSRSDAQRLGSKAAQYCFASRHVYAIESIHLQPYHFQIRNKRLWLLDLLNSSFFWPPRRNSLCFPRQKNQSKIWIDVMTTMEQKGYNKRHGTKGIIGKKI